MITKAEHIGIMVTDMERSLAFYQNILGLTLRDRRVAGSGSVLAFLEVGNVEIELIAGPGHYYQGDGVVNHLAFNVSNLDEALAHLRENQVEVISPQPIQVGEHMRVAFFRGPDGEKLEFVEKK